MRNLFFVLITVCSMFFSAHARTVEIKMFETTDIHGSFFPYDFIHNTFAPGSLAKISTIINNARNEYGDNVILLDNGDILQGQPSSYYYNYVDTVSPHIVSQIFNYMKYDAGNIGNHDVETGINVMNRWISQCDMPILGANVLDARTGEQAYTPYVIIQRDGVKIAVLGMITPAIPAWLPENVWEGLDFADMQETAEKWLPIIKEKENPDIIVGLFHAGEDGKLLMNFKENPSAEIAENVPGFDLILYGHDHKRENREVVNVQGDSVLLINPANNGQSVAEVTITLEIDNEGNVIDKKFKGNLIKVDDYPADPSFLTKFTPQFNAIKGFTNEVIGYNENEMSSREAYFGPSSYVDFLHAMQLYRTGADISFCAPLSFDATIPKGYLTNGDMFDLVKYENFLYVMEFTGQEIKDYLDESYGNWVHEMKSSYDPMFILRDDYQDGDVTRSKFLHPAYNFDSAAGIIYTVDVTKPKGSKVNIISMADGSEFDPAKTYKVAINSYRANGGGELVTEGAGIPKSEIDSRIVHKDSENFRYYLTEDIKKMKSINPQPLNQWRFIPDDIVAPAKIRERVKLFGTE